MGKLIVDGNSVYEIDEDCLKNRYVPEGCKVYEAFEESKRKEQQEREFQKRRGR